MTHAVAVPCRRVARPALVAACLVALTGALAPPAHAGDGTNAALRGQPVSKFNDTDYALMKARVDEALAAEKDGGVLTWKNDKSGASGSVVPLNRLVWSGLQCRRLRIANATTTPDLQAEGVYKFCQKPVGHWKLVGPDPG